MSSEWCEVRLSEVIEVTDYVANGSFAALKENVTYQENGYAILARLVDHNAGWEGPHVFVNEAAYKFLSKSSLQPGDIVIANVGANAGTVFRIPFLRKPVTLGPNAVRVRPKKEALPKIDSDYLYYYLGSPVGQEKLQSLITGSAQPKFNKTALRGLSLEFPEISQQRSIARILLAIDGRISLLRETNATLEAIAQALFKSWFVDFDPVRAKMEGRQPEGMDEATAALFPDSFDETELGVVPTGWAIQTMADVSTVGIGKTPPRKEQHWFSENSEDVRWISIRDMGLVGTYASSSSEYLTNEAVERFNVRRVPDNTVIMSFKMTIGRVAITDGEMTTNEAIAHFKLSAGAAVSTEYLYLHFKQFDFTKLSSTSSIADAVNSKTVREIPVLVPSLDVMTVFKEKIAAIFSALKNAEQQANTLMTLRETLLPRLISGQLRIDDLLGVANV